MGAAVLTPGPRRALLEPTKRASSRCFPPVAPPKFIADPRLRAHRVDDLFPVADLILPAPKGAHETSGGRLIERGSSDQVEIVSQPTHASLPIPTRDALLLTPTSDVLSCSPCVPDPDQSYNAKEANTSSKGKIPGEPNVSSQWFTIKFSSKSIIFDFYVHN
ncbi:hypothetical protein E2562_021331 [Oryza meyeriana var. granulata]|uniref:Uncharacterized protein n=1 Tax=Oryza meyeriana var. granulata TaxID=110450 RepID=A0A6G1BYT8_9ORYZ|nr:hypothetical protein E2562_021331 [Oryza meyeriana var. granulata]